VQENPAQLRDIANAPLPARGLLLLSQLRQGCRESGATALIQALAQQMEATGITPNSTQGSGLLTLAAFALADAPSAAPVPHPGPLDLSRRSTCSVECHALAVAASDQRLALDVEQASSLIALARAVAASPTDFPGRRGFLDYSAAMVVALNSTPLAGDLQPALRAVLDAWRHWQHDAFYIALEAMWQGEEPDYLKLWLDFGLNVPTGFSAEVRAALWQLAIEGGPALTDAETANQPAPALQCGPLMQRLRDGEPASAVIERFMVSDTALADWIRTQASALAPGGPHAQ